MLNFTDSPLLCNYIKNAQRSTLSNKLIISYSSPQREKRNIESQLRFMPQGNILHVLDGVQLHQFTFHRFPSLFVLCVYAFVWNAKEHLSSFVRTTKRDSFNGRKKKKIKIVSIINSCTPFS